MKKPRRLPYLLHFYKLNQQWIDRCLDAYEIGNRERLKLINKLITKSYSGSLINKGPVSAQFDYVMKDFLKNMDFRKRMRYDTQK